MSMEWGSPEYIDCKYHGEVITLAGKCAVCLDDMKDEIEDLMEYYTQKQETT